MTDDIKAIRDALAAGPVAGPWNTAEYTDHDGPPECDDIAIQATDPRRPLHLETLALMNWADKVPMVAAFTRSEGMATAAYIAACHPERIARLLDALEQAQAALSRITDLDPATDSEEGYNEWGEADCFNQAQKIAAAALKRGA